MTQDEVKHVCKLAFVLDRGEDYPFLFKGSLMVGPTETCIK